MKTLFVSGILFAGLFQVPSTPPMKMGLWESGGTVTMKMTGGNMPNMPPRTSKVHTCVTPDSIAKAFASTQRSTCTMSGEKWTSKGFSMDLSCAGGNGSGHVEMIFDTPESGHGTMHMDMNANGHAMSMDSVMTAKYLGADCGAVVPGKPLTVQ